MTYASDEQLEEAISRFHSNSSNILEIMRTLYPRADWSLLQDIPEESSLEEPHLDLYGGVTLRFTVMDVEIELHSIIHINKMPDAAGITEGLSRYAGMAVMAALQQE